MAECPLQFCCCILARRLSDTPWNVACLQLQRRSRRPFPNPCCARRSREMLEWRDAGASIVEISHRGPEFMRSRHGRRSATLRTLLSIPDDYAVLFIQGGATTQQALIPLNFAAPGQPADYVLTGHWGKTALKQAKPYVATHVAATQRGRRLPLDPRAQRPGSSPPTRPTSTSRRTKPSTASSSATSPTSATCRWSPTSAPPSRASRWTSRRFGIVYAGAQKNLGPVGHQRGDRAPRPARNAPASRAPTSSTTARSSRASRCSTRRRPGTGTCSA